ncbi:S41 family peptidase [Tissierella sp.]|uniref:S41 family peptidase n=1 Tax=Tissierella sp. TaxID=41274 RepID=UPI00286233DD|nr:S41 family peptidase [Tissierella sp.]MDR7855822.1 S41 family peptidase [Tissierella sp.]
MKFRFRRKKYKPIYLVVILLVFSLIVYIKSTNGNTRVKPLTMEQKLEDFEYLYDFISENYPFLKVNERVNGIDWLGEKEVFKNAIKNTNADYEFEYEISNIIRQLNNDHTHILTKDMFGYFYTAYADLEYEDHYKPWADVLKDEDVLNRYAFDEKKLEEYEAKQTFYADLSYCKTDIIVPDEVAYLKISQMNTESIENDGLIIREFFGEIKDYEKLIIDIRGNQGGNDLYWIKNVIEPLANKELSVKNYLFLRYEYAKYFYEHRGIAFSPITELDKNIFDSFPEEIKIDFNYYSLSPKTIKPVDPVGFSGKIYLLVDERVFSSAESFASFSKDSGFATLVGETTGGDGIGLDPILFSLPNSKMVIRYSGMLVLNNDGTINEEVHTIPNVVIDATIGSMYEKDISIQYVIND